MNGVKGTCGLCGGRVFGHVGPWGAVIPPPPGVCERCGAEEASAGPVLDMVPRRQVPAEAKRYVAIGGDCGCSNGCKAWDCRNL